MTSRKRISSVSVQGLHGTFNYDLRFPSGEDTVILIAPNGYGKTAFLSLINDCLAFRLSRAATKVFEELNFRFEDKTRWRFVRKYGDDIATERALRRRSEYRAYAAHIRHENRNPFWVDVIRFDPAGKIIEDVLPDLGPAERQAIMRNIERNEPWILHSEARPAARNSDIYSKEVLQSYFDLIGRDESVRQIISRTNPSFVWPGVDRFDCLFIETQRLLYEEKSAESTQGGSSHKEEIVRQAESLSKLLQQNYTEYAATSQALDRSFPNRLIQRAQEGQEIEASQLKGELEAIERKRAELTEVGILVEQADAIAATDDQLMPKVLDALQIYVEDSHKKLATYDAIYPKLDVFTDLVGKKLEPKKLIINRETGALIEKTGGKDEKPKRLSLGILSSGEKHEFIMLFKLIFETNPDTLVLIDEPEISLHVVWQLEFMSDLRRVQGANPFQCIIATHSPQIFQGFKHLLVDLADQV